MSNIKYDITLYNSPFFEDLINELFRISRYKRNIYKNIRNEEEYKKKLSFEERSILKDLSTKENKIILEILINKCWLDLPSNFIDYFRKNLDNKYNPNFSMEDEKYNNNPNVL